MSAEVERFVGEVSAFTALDDAGRRALAASVTMRHVAAGELLLEQGAPGTHACLLRHGTAEVLRDGRRVDLLGPGDVCGEAAVLTGEPRSASVRALDDVTVLEVGRAELLATLGAQDAARADLLYVARSRARPRRAPEVEATRVDGPEPVTVLKHPGTGTYFRLSERGRFVWDRLDGDRTVGDLTLDWAEAFGVLDPHAVIRLLLALDRAGVLAGAALWAHAPAPAPARGPLLARALRALRWWWVHPAPDAWFARAHARWGRHLLGPVGLAAGALLAVAGVVALLAGARAGTAALADRPALALLVLPGLMAGTVVHELAHGLAVKQQGREVRRAGLGWLWYRPAGFVDTSDMWLAPARARVAVSLAGPAASLGLGGLLAVAAWAAGDGLAAGVLWSTATPLVVSCAVQLCPALETDGYHVLRDTLDRPRLREDALVWAVRGGPRPGAHRAEAGYLATTGLWLGVVGAAQLLLVRAWLERVLDGVGFGGAAPGAAWVLAVAPLALFALVLGDDVRAARRSVRTSVTHRASAP